MEKREPYEKFLKDALAALHDGKTTLNDGHVPYVYVWGGDMADIFLAKNRHYRITIKREKVKDVLLSFRRSLMETSESEHTENINLNTFDYV